MVSIVIYLMNALTIVRCFLTSSLHSPKQILCIVCDAKRICRLSLIFRYLLRPEMMVIYTYNIIYGFLAKNSKPPRGGYTQDTQFSKSRCPLESKTPPYVFPSIPPNHGISRHITAFPLNPF